MFRQRQEEAEVLAGIEEERELETLVEQRSFVRRRVHPIDDVRIRVEIELIAERSGRRCDDAKRRTFVVEEMAAKTTVKLAFPVVLFIFPTVLVVLGGPAFILFYKSPLFQ